MSCRVDTAPLISGACVVSAYPGHGVRGDQVPSTGTHGPSPVYNDLTLPADDAKEYRWGIVTPPSVGTLVVYEDCSYAYTPPGGTVNLTVPYTYRLWEDGVDRGTATENIVIGAAGAGAAGVTLTAAAGIIVGSASGNIASMAPGAVLAAAASLIRGAASGGAATIYRPTSDVSAVGWTATPPGPLYDAIDEASANDADFITSPPIASAGPATFGIGPLPAGTYRIRVRASTNFGVGILRVKFLDVGGATLATSADQAITNVPTTYEPEVTIAAGVATQARIEVAA